MDNPMMDDTPQPQSQEVSQEALQESRLSILFSESDSLFLQNLESDDIITNDVDAAKYMWALKRLDEKLNEIKETKKQFMDFFKAKEESIEDTQSFLGDKLIDYLKTKDSNVISPAGTAYLVERKQINYPDEETLLEYSKQHDLPIKVTEKAYKSEIKKFVEDGGEPPEGYSTTDITSLGIRRS